MAKNIEVKLDQDIKRKTEKFLKNAKSSMYFKSNISSMLNDLEWLDKIEYAVPYIDNVIRNPRVALISESEVQDIAKAKKTGVDSVKDLSRHTNYIETVDEKGFVKPSKILVLLREETYNTYENRIMYCLIDDLSRFILKKEEGLKKLTAKGSKELSYISKTVTGSENVYMEFKLSSFESGEGAVDKSRIQREIDNFAKRLKRVRKLITIWQNSDMISTLAKSHVPPVLPPIRKTNLLLKNANYKTSSNLWLYIRSLLAEEDKKDEYFKTGGNHALLSLLDDSFLLNFMVLDSMSDSPAEQKDMLLKYGLVVLIHEVERILNLFLKNGIKISEDELLKLIKVEMGNSLNRNLIGSNDIKKKFQKEMEGYLSKVKEGL